MKKSWKNDDNQKSLVVIISFSNDADDKPYQKLLS